MTFDLELIRRFMIRLLSVLMQHVKLINRSLTLTEKILYAHLEKDAPGKVYERGKDYVNFLT